MYGEDKFRKYLANDRKPHKTFFDRPHWTRRRFFEVCGTGLTGALLAQRARAAEVIPYAQVETINKARNVLFVLLAGAPSHVDMFDFKMTEGTTPADFNPVNINGIQWPAGLMPKLADNLGDIAIVRSMRAYALVHNLAQTWTQIGRNPTAALGDIAPNIGSIVAIEKEVERKPGQAFPTFLALNSNGAAGSGYLPSTYAPFKTTPSVNGLANTTNPDGSARLDERWNLLHQIDGPLRVNSPHGRAMQDMNAFYDAAKGMTYNPAVDQAFKFTTADAARYGTSGFGNACLVAKQVLAANQGTRFIQITFGGWDMHNDIYDRQAIGRNLYSIGSQFDQGLSGLLNDLKSAGLLNETLVVVVGEFGRTVGRLNAASGRDHFLQQFCVFAGGGVKGGRVIGATNADGSATTEYGWSRNRDVRPEDVEATVYSAMGINWTNVRFDDPYQRGFEYVPNAKDDIYGPINELWA